jgi:glutamate-1-semialdehyde 2,1-aminomutase
MLPSVNDQISFSTRADRMKIGKSRELFERARTILPGGVNSPVRSFKAVDASPLFIDRAEGPYLFDRDGNRFIDYVGSFGPAILGHAHPIVVQSVAEQTQAGFGYGASTALEVELAELILGAVGSAEKIRLMSSGTEAGMTAIRLARAATGRQIIVKFDGCYHGHSDSLLVRSGSGPMTLGTPDSGGVPEAVASLTRAADFNSPASLEGFFEAEGARVAAVILEPVPANMGVVRPEGDFLRRVSAAAHNHGALVICDEVITGFRLRFGPAGEMFGCEPDIYMFGKIIGGGMPVGAIAAKSKLMDFLAPLGPVYQAGTLSGNPLSMRAGIETLRELQTPGTYERLDKAGARLEVGLRDALKSSSEIGCVNRVGSLLTIFFGVDRVIDAASARRADTKKFALFFRNMLQRGIFLPPSQFEAMFVSLAHSDQVIDETVRAAHLAIGHLKSS